MFIASGSSKLFAPQKMLMENYDTGATFMSSLQDTGYLFILLAITQIVAACF